MAHIYAPNQIIRALYHDSGEFLSGLGSLGFQNLGIIIGVD